LWTSSRKSWTSAKGPVDDLLNLVVSATVYAAEHPNDATLPDAIEVNYASPGCENEDCEDPDGCEDPEHNDVVGMVLGWIAELT